MSKLDARHAVSKLPEIVQRTADMANTYAAYNQHGDVWALVRNRLGDTVEYRGSADAPLERRRLDPKTDVESLLFRKSLEGYEDLSSEALPTAPFDEEGGEDAFRGRRRRKRSKRSK